MKQCKLAELMQVSPQQISKIVSGSENLTIETQIKLQNILNIPILASFYENEDTQAIAMPPLNEKYHLINSGLDISAYSNSTLGELSTLVIENKSNVLVLETAS
jgi:transcriptional regulator with XRE-family HTH domain